MKIPVFLPVTRELGSETSSLKTVSSSRESRANGGGISKFPPDLECRGHY